MIFLLFGFVIEIIFIGIMTFKTIIPLKIYVFSLIASIFLNILGLFYFLEYKETKAFYLCVPFFFLFIYQILRFSFKLFFRNEPILSGYLQKSWDQGEYRRLHYGDAIFTILLLFLPAIVCGILISNI